MIISTSKFVPKGFAACAVWPFIFVKPEYRNHQGLIAHEMVHYREQRKVLTLPWLLLYFCSKRFRMAAEVRAYRREIQAGTISADAAAFMLLDYRLGITLDEAKKALA